VVHEERIPVELCVTGHIPAYAAGTLYRTGPGGREIMTERGTIWNASHWFDGFTQVHRFQILEPDPTDRLATTRVFYNSRRGTDGMIEEIRRTGKLPSFSFGQKRDPCESYFRKIMALFQGKPTDTVPSDTRNTGVTISINPPGFPSRRQINEKETQGHTSGIRSLWNKTDSAMLKEIDPNTLEPIGLALQRRLHPDLQGAFSAAHPRSDPITGDFFNYNLKLGKNAIYKIFRISGATGKTDVIATISAPGAYLHSLFLTENFVILCVWGSHYANYGLKVLWERNILDAIADLDPRDSKKRSKWFVVDRHHDRGVVAAFEGDSFFCFHTINAYEVKSKEDDKVDIILDLTVYENMDVIKRFYYENIRSSSPCARAFFSEKGDTARGNLNRWRLPGVDMNKPSRASNQGSADSHPGISVPEPFPKAVLEWEAPKNKTVELPSINPKFITRTHRYIYGVADRGFTTFVDGLHKYDTETHAVRTWEFHGQNPGEPIFVPDPRGRDEDDGVLLSVVLDGHTGKSYLLVLNAKNMLEVGRAEMVSVYFCSCWVLDADVQLGLRCSIRFPRHPFPRKCAGTFVSLLKG
jgi:torulene dioxygenase